MKKLVLIMLCMSIFSPAGLAKSGSKKSARTRNRAKAVTVTGCIRQGVECLVLEPLSGNQKYSIARRSGLEIGAAYRITGSTSNISICQQGFPTLNPRRITRLRISCPKGNEKQKNANIREPRRGHSTRYRHPRRTGRANSYDTASESHPHLNRR